MTDRDIKPAIDEETLRAAYETARAFMRTSYDYRQITAVDMERIAAAFLVAFEQRATLAARKEVMSDALAKIWQAADGDPTPEVLAQIKQLADLEGQEGRIAELRAKFLGEPR